MPNPNKLENGLWEATHKDGNVSHHTSRTEARNALKGILPAPPEPPTLANESVNVEPPEHFTGEPETELIETPTEAPVKVPNKLAKAQKEPAVVLGNFDGLEGNALVSALLYGATNKLSVAENELIRSKKMTFSQAEVLLALPQEAAQGPVTQRFLSESLNCTGGNVTMILDSLQKKGLITRERNASDRRAMDVAMTKEGRVLAKVFAKNRQSITEQFFKELEEKDVKALTRLLKKLVSDAT